MKKLLSLIIIVSLTVVSYAQKTDSIPDTAKLTLGKVYSDVKAGINGLAQSLKVPATHVYEVMVKQQFVNSITSLIFDVVLILLSSIVLYHWAKDKDKEEWWAFPALCAVVTILAMIFNLSDIVGGFVNPEYGAIKEIISFVK